MIPHAASIGLGSRIQPAPATGFVCSYAVQDDRLLLDTLEIGLEPDHPRVSLHGKTPRMAGRRQHHPGAAIYRRLAMPISFTGRLLLADELDLYTHMGFQPAWHYEKVVELVVAECQHAATGVEDDDDLASPEQSL